MAFQGDYDTLKVLQPTMIVDEADGEFDLDQLQNFYRFPVRQTSPCQARKERKGNEKVTASSLKAA